MKLEHGRDTTYTNHGCRCQPCTTAHADATRARRARQPKLDDEDPRHGTDHAYSNLSCRCQACRAAHTSKVRAAREAARPA